MTSEEGAQGSMKSDEEAQTDYLNFMMISCETCWFIIMIWSHHFFFANILRISCKYFLPWCFFLATCETAKELATLLILSKWDVIMKSSLVALVGPTNRSHGSTPFNRTPSWTYTKFKKYKKGYNKWNCKHILYLNYSFAQTIERVGRVKLVFNYSYRCF